MSHTVLRHPFTTLVVSRTHKLGIGSDACVLGATTATGGALSGAAAFREGVTPAQRDKMATTADNSASPM